MSIHGRSAVLGPFVAALVAALGATGCSCDESSDGTALALSFVSPDEGETLACAADGDRDTDDVLERDVEVLVRLGAADHTGLSVQLRVADTTISATAEVPETGIVAFPAFPLPLGTLVLQADLIDGPSVVAMSTRSVITVIDPANDPDCNPDPPPPDTTLEFASPIAGTTFGADDDADDTLANDLQIDVSVRVDGPTDGPVSLTVDGTPAGEATVSGGRATFSGVTLAIGDGAARGHTLAAVVPSPSGDVDASIQVNTEVAGCALTLAPMPTEGTCDLTAADDVDAGTEGIQVDLVAQSDCAAVTFTLNGAALGPVDVVAGEATMRATFTEGENTLEASAATPGGLSGSVAAYTLVAGGGDAPTATLDLESMGVNGFDLTNAEPTEGEEAAFWRLTGASDGLVEGAAVALAFDPPIAGVPEAAVVAADGTFAVDVAVEYYCGDVTVSTTDVCGVAHPSVAYAVCFDGVRPALSIAAPADGAALMEDADAERPGLQVPFLIDVVDPRPGDIDYTVTVECTTEPPAFDPAYTLDGDGVARSALVDGQGTVIVTVPLNVGGALTCRATADPAPNPVSTLESTFNVVLDTPTFTLIEPRTDPAGPVCSVGPAVVGGTGTGLEGAALSAVVTPAGGDALDAVPLVGIGAQFLVRFDGVGANPAPLADGRYSVAVSGDVAGVPVAVMPAAVDFIIDSTAPVPALAAPAVDVALGLADDANGDLADCVQTTLTLAAADANTTRLCYSLNGGVERCDAPGEDGQRVTAQVSLLDGDNALSVRAVDCAGNEATAQITIPTAGCAPRLQIVSPADGERVLPVDVDDQTEGLQIDVEIESGLSEGAFVQVRVEDQVSDAVAVDAGGAATVRVTLPVPADPQGELTFTLQAEATDGGAISPESTVIVVYVAPTIELDAVDGCVNAAAPDAGIEPGFQRVFGATTEGLAPGTDVTLTADCGGPPTVAQGTVGGDGRVQFAPITLADDADCALTATAMDAAGQVAEGLLAVEIDRIAPTIRFGSPQNGATVSLLNDIDPEADGIQYEPSVVVCGAPGQAVTVEASYAPAPFELQTADDQDCTTLRLGQATLPLGPLTFDTATVDACGNPATVRTVADVDSGEVINITQPAQGAVIARGADVDPETPTCEVNLQATLAGLGAGAQIAVCTTFDNGQADALCGDGFSAVVPGEACAVAGAVTCPLRLADGQHTLTVVGEFGERIESAPVTVTVDCTAPTVELLTVDEAGADACVNRRERGNIDAASNNAAVTLRVRTVGLEDGQPVALLDGANQIARRNVMNNEATASLTLMPGVYNIRAQGMDAAGNPLPQPGDAGATVYTVVIDTLPPTPGLVNVAADMCLNAAADSAPAAGLQYDVTASAGGAVDERVTLALNVDGDDRVLEMANPEEVFEAVTFAEGPNQLVLTSTDACGNVGSVGGFIVADGRADWTQPLPINLRTDTVAPALTLGGVNEGQVLAAADDADGDAGNGFQRVLQATFDPVDGIEAGQTVRFRSGDQALVTTPAQVVVPADLAGPVSATVTLPPGPHALTARATDTCGNLGASAPINIEVDIQGCPSQLGTFAENPAVLGAADGVRDGDTLRVDLAGTVSLLDPACANGVADIVIDDVPLGLNVAVGAGAVAFDDVPLPRGAHEVKLRVTESGVQTDSILQEVIVDFDQPTVTITDPAGPDPAQVLTDTRPETAGQQMRVVASVTEAMVDSPRTATLTIDGVPAGEAVEVVNNTATFTRITVPAGLATLEVCATDQAGNEGCGQRQINADPAAPGGFVPAPEITDPRLTRTTFTFTAPGDDGAAGGPVAAYRIRQSFTAIADQAAWDQATDIAGLVQAHDIEAPGAQQTLIVDGLALNRLSHVAIRAVDDVGRLGPISSVEVDLRLATTAIDFGPTGGGAWGGDTFGLTNRMVASVGDMDGDGYDDLFVYGIIFASGASGAAIIFGAEDAADAELVRLEAPAGSLFYAVSGGPVGDVNGDGAPDVLVAGARAGAGGGFDFVGSIYFGCPPLTADCRAQIPAADAGVVHTGGRLFSHVVSAGNFYGRATDAAPIGDIAFGGDGGGWNRVVVVAGREDWPALPALVEMAAPGVAAGVVELQSTTTRAGLYMAGIGDLDGDGFGELALGSGPGINVTEIFYGSEDPASPQLVQAPNLVLPDPCPSANPTFGTFFAGGVDLDGDADGAPDFIVTNRGNKRLAVFDQDLANIDCVRRNEQLWGQTVDLAGDVNNDGETDIVVTHGEQANTTVQVMYNDGAGRFGIGEGVVAQRAADVQLGGPPYFKLAAVGAGRFDGDAYDDLAIIVKIPGGDLRVVVFH